MNNKEFQGSERANLVVMIMGSRTKWSVLWKMKKNLTVFERRSECVCDYLNVVYV